MKKFFHPLIIVSALFTTHAYASDQQIITAIEKLGINQKDIQIIDTTIPNFKSVVTPGGILYMSADGKYLAQGPIYDMSGDTPKNLANTTNLALINKISNSAIVYPAKNEKYKIFIFTDPTCHYCQLLHKNLDQYLDEGISVHYLAFPREGLNSQAATDMQSIWSVADRKSAFENAYKGNKISPATGMVSYVKMHFDAGRQIGVTGTPAIILPSGQLIGGYVPAKDLLNLLEQDAK